ncbi:hypothetical protein D3C72_1806310 [compost metagenome]
MAPGVLKANSAVTVLPTGTAPAARSIPTQHASNRAAPPVSAGTPKPVGMPATSITSLTPIGTPASRPPVPSSGASSASGPTTWLHARMTLSISSIAAKLARAAASGAAAPARTRREISWTDRGKGATGMTYSGKRLNNFDAES